MSHVMEDMRANYEKMALKNAEELKMWHESQVQNRWPPHNNNFALTELLQANLTNSFSSDIRSSGAGGSEHRSTTRCTDGDEWPTATDANARNRACIPTKPGNVHMHTILYVLDCCIFNEIRSLWWNCFYRKRRLRTRCGTQSYVQTQRWRSTTPSCCSLKLSCHR